MAWKNSGGGTFWSCPIGRELVTLFGKLRLFPCEQTIEIVAVGSEAAKVLLVEEPLNAAIEANLVGDSLGANRPAHLAVPAAAH